MAAAASQLRTRTRADYRFFQTYRLRWSDNDMYGHVNNSVYNFLIDSITNTYLISHCLLRPTSADTTRQIGLVVSSHCSFFAPLSYPGVVDLGLRVNKVGRSSVVYEVGFFEGHEEGDEERGGKEGREKETARAVGGFIHVWVTGPDRRPVVKMEEGVRAGLEGLLVREDAKL
ncbi:thioesterase thiol ester dehydrase-isomerase [Geopyxis carbonaria]|nr:thioesterase thiol ester dehydrase-isomerase [Geopyxis carbonaria]